MKHQLRLLTALLAILALVAALVATRTDDAEVADDHGRGPRARPGPRSADPGTPGNIPDPRHRFDGVEVVVAGPAGQLDYMKAKAAEWAAETGATVRVDEIPFGELNDKVLAALSTDTFIADIINIGSNLGGDLMGGGFMAARTRMGPGAGRLGRHPADLPVEPVVVRRGGLRHALGRRRPDVLLARRRLRGVRRRVRGGHRQCPPSGRVLERVRAPSPSSSPRTPGRAWMRGTAWWNCPCATTKVGTVS